MAATNLGSTTTTKITNYPLNAWYVAAWDHEIGTGQMLARTLLVSRQPRRVVEEIKLPEDANADAGATLVM